MPATREWKSAGTSFFGGEGYSPYGLVLGAGDQLVKRLNETNTSDQDRRVILAKFMRILRTQVPHEIDRELWRLLENNGGLRGGGITGGNGDGKRGQAPIKR